MAKNTKTKVLSPGQLYEKGKKLTGKGMASTKKWYVGMEKKLTPQQRLLTKKLPTALWKTAKWAFKAPLSASAIVAAPMIVHAVGKKLPGMKFPSSKQWTKKGRWMV